jgi:AraC family transcriptional activator of mtrCDE
VERRFATTNLYTRNFNVRMGLETVPERPERGFVLRTERLDVIERLFANLEVGVGVFATCDVREGYQLTFDARPAVGLHYCLEGEGALMVRNGEVIELQAHSFVLLPPNVIYTIGSRGMNDAGCVPRPRLKAPVFQESVPTILAGDGDPGLLTACGEVRFEGLSIPALFTGLDRPLVEHFTGVDGLRDQFVRLLAESAAPGIGARPLTEALLKQCLILLLRRKIDRGAGPIPWMVALNDAGLARALEAILERYAERFTVEKLASIARMSRSSFAARFTEAFGQTPMNMLKAARLRRAREMLATTNASIEEVASSVGFSSRSNFSHAFREAFGADPTSFRKQALVRAR